MDTTTSTPAISVAKIYATNAYDPQTIGQAIQDILYKGTGTDEEITDAYPDVMIYLESQNLAPTAENIQANEVALQNAIDTHNGGLSGAEVIAMADLNKITEGNSTAKLILLVVVAVVLFNIFG
jgi:hypothetical protein